MFPFDNEDDDDDDQIIDNGQQQDDQIDDQQVDDGQQQQQAAPPAAPAFDSRAIAEIVSATMQSMRPAEPQRQMTAEEAAQHFQVFNPDDNFVNGLNKLADADATPAERREIVNQLRDGLVNQSFRAAELLVEQKMAEMEKQFSPAVQYMQQREAKNLQKEFETQYPALKGQSELVNSITASLTQQGFRPKDKNEAFEKVAQFAEKILKGVNPEFTLGQKQQRGGTRMPSMAGTNMGGNTGGFQAAPVASASGKRGGLAPFFLNK